jgi:hypothetical protein
MKHLIMAAFMLVFGTIVLSAQDDELDDWAFDSEPLKEEKTPYFALAGGYTGTVFFANMDDINTMLNGVFDFETDALSSTMYFHGFEIFTGIPFIENFRAGFYTKSGSTMNEFNLDDEAGSMRHAEYSISNSGINFEYAFVPTSKLAITFGTGIGWGNVQLDIYQSVENIDWNEITTNQPNETFFHRAEAGFLMLEPKLNIEYAVQSWLALRVSGNYALSFMETGLFSDASWQYNQSSGINNFSEDINASGLGVQFGLMIGLFNY